MTNDADHILSQIIINLQETIDGLNQQLTNGNVSHIEDYKYKLGARISLVAMQEYINNLTRLK